MAYRHKIAPNVMGRPNKLARGMTQTAYHCRHTGKMNTDASRLSVLGTTDRLAHLLLFTTARTADTCTHCGQRLKLRQLNDHGRRKLARMRRERLHG